MVLFTATAAEHAQVVGDWWAAERPGARNLFADEFSAAIDRLSAVPGTGACFEFVAVAGLRRVLPARSRYHVYYTVHPVRREVLVRAIWHASRGQGPELS